MRPAVFMHIEGILV